LKFLIFYPNSILVVLSAACFIVGTAFLAKSIRWQSDTLANTDNSELAKKARRMGSPGRTEIYKLRISMFLNAVGYALLVISTIISP
jgi:hypothetical protein